jgi:acetyltransferase-like isoleucine patch superfamily enzyme
MFSTDPFLVRIGKNTHIVQKTVFVTHDGGTLALRHLVPDLEITKPITVGENCYLGMGVLVMPGVKIGNNVVIGAGSVVTKDIPDNSVAVGVPARVIKSIEQYREKLEEQSLHLGHLPGKEKAAKLREIYKEFIKESEEIVRR